MMGFGSAMAYKPRKMIFRADHGFIAFLGCENYVLFMSKLQNFN